MEADVDGPAVVKKIQEKAEAPVSGVSTGLISDRRVVPFYERALPKLDRHGRDPASYALHLGFWDAKTYRYRQAVDNENRALARLAGSSAATGCSTPAVGLERAPSGSRASWEPGWWGSTSRPAR